MNPADMAALALEAIRDGSRMTMVRIKGSKPPPGFPRGELLCENSNGRNVYSYPPERVIKWLRLNKLIAIEVKVDDSNG